MTAVGRRSEVGPATVWAAVAWAAALLAWQAAGPDCAFGVPPGSRLAWVGVGLVIALACWRVPGSAPVGGGPSGVASARRWLALGILLVVVAVGGHATLQRCRAAVGPVVAVAADGGARDLVGQVASEPVVQADGGSWALVRVVAAPGPTRELVLWSHDQHLPPVGATVRLHAGARPLADDGFEGWLRRRHAVAGLVVHGATVERGPTGILRAVEALRAGIRSAAGRGLGGDRAGLAVGLVTGDTRLLSPEARDAMAAAGLSHLVAVSGSNVAVVLGLVLALCAPLGARTRRLAAVTALVAFAVTTRAEPSVLRASVMAGIVLVAGARGRPSSPLHALAGAVLLLLVVDPAAAGSLGLALSVAATLGVLVVAPPVVGRLSTWAPGWAARLLGTTLGAQVAVAPVVLMVADGVPLWSVPANAVAVPAAAVASLVALVAAVVAPVGPDISAGLFRLAAWPLEAVLATARLAADGPVASLATPGLLAAVALGMAAALGRAGGRLRRRSVVALLVLVAATHVVPSGSSWTPPARLAVTAIDVGQGDALLVTTSSGHRVLVDAGRDERAADWLAANRVGSLDLLVVTHADQDHAGGVPAVVDRLQVAAVWVAVHPDGHPGAPVVDGTRIPAGIADRIRGVATGDHARIGSASFQVLSPPAGRALVATGSERNDRSLVLRVVEGPRVALLPGDIEHAAQADMLRSGLDLGADLLVVPHHGAATSDANFLRAVAPTVAIVSVGQDNDYGHPRAEVLDVVGQSARILRTDLHGTVTVEVPP